MDTPIFDQLMERLSAGGTFEDAVAEIFAADPAPEPGAGAGRAPDGRDSATPEDTPAPKAAATPAAGTHAAPEEDAVAEVVAEDDDEDGDYGLPVGWPTTA